MSKNSVPRHVAIIMDGNRRYSKQKGNSPLLGWSEGEERLHEIVRYAVSKRISYLTVFALSSENFNRNESHLKEIFSLLTRVIDDRGPTFVKEGIRINFVGNWSRIPFDIATRMQQLEQDTRFPQGCRISLNVAIDFSGQEDILRATKSLVKRVVDGELHLEDIDENAFASALSVLAPPPDLLIRTGHEKRISNFMLWELAYTELYFSELMWPEFGVEAFDSALADFASRERRYGGDGE